MNQIKYYHEFYHQFKCIKIFEYINKYCCKFHPEFIQIELNVNDDGNIRKMKYNPIHKHTLNFSLNACQNNELSGKEP